MAEIMQKTCPSLSPKYLNILTEIYFSFHAQEGKIWNNEDASQLLYWKNASEFMGMCLNRVKPNTVCKTQLISITNN